MTLVRLKRTAWILAACVGVPFALLCAGGFNRTETVAVEPIVQDGYRVSVKLTSHWDEHRRGPFLHEYPLTGKGVASVGVEDVSPGQTEAPTLIHRDDAGREHSHVCDRRAPDSCELSVDIRNGYAAPLRVSALRHTRDGALQRADFELRYIRRTKLSFRLLDLWASV